MKKPLFLLIILAFLVQATAQTLSLDPSFGENGSYLRQIPNTFAGSYRIIPLENGQFLLLSIFQNEVAEQSAYLLSKHHENGELDKSFGSEGDFFFSLDQVEYPTDFAVMEDGRIVISSFDPPSSINVILLEADGNLINEYSYTLEDDPNLSSYYLGFRVKSHGEYFYIGGNYFIEDEDESIGLFILKSDNEGKLDPSFAEDGIYTFEDAFAENHFQDFLVLEEGIFLYSNQYDFQDGEYYTQLRQLNHDGQLNPDFGDAGLVSIPGFESEFADIFYHNEKIFLSICEYNTVISFDMEGNLNGEYGWNGIASIPNAEEDYYGYFSTMSEEGEIRIFGINEDWENEIYQAIIAGFNSLGEPDQNLGLEGIYVASLDGQNIAILNGAFAKKGDLKRMYVVGYTGDFDSGGAILVQRYIQGISGTKDLNLSDDQLLTLYPNPVIDHTTIHIKFDSILSGKVEVNLWDMAGKEKIELLHEIQLKGKKELEIILKDQLLNGFYTLECITEKGRQIEPVVIMR